MFKHFPKQLQSEGRPYVTNGGVLDGQKWSRHARALHSQDDDGDGAEGARGRVNAMWASFRVFARKRSLVASCAARVGGRDFPPTVDRCLTTDCKETEPHGMQVRR